MNTKGAGMVFVTNSWKMWLAGTAASLVIFAIVFFTVIQPSSNTANNAVKAGLQQSQQALNQAQHQISNAGSQTAAAGSQGAAQQTVTKAQKLVACLASAGTDVSKVQACQAKYAG
jgi:ABC-type uncharacterized transport system fused permease/ATPase subunit